MSQTEDLEINVPNASKRPKRGTPFQKKIFGSDLWDPDVLAATRNLLVHVSY